MVHVDTMLICINTLLCFYGLAFRLCSSGFWSIETTLNIIQWILNFAILIFHNMLSMQLNYLMIAYCNHNIIVNCIIVKNTLIHRNSEQFA